MKKYGGLVAKKGFAETKKAAPGGFDLQYQITYAAGA